MCAFQAYLLRFIGEAAAPLRLPAHPGSALRGALFAGLRSQFCQAPVLPDGRRPSCGLPPFRHNCPVCFLLAPQDELAPRGRDLPRPYAIHPRSEWVEAGAQFAPGERLEFGLVTFGKALAHFPYVMLGMEEVGRRGLGVGRGRFHLVEVWAEQPLTGRQGRVYVRADPTVRVPNLPITWDHVREEAGRLSRAGGGRLGLRFRMPLRLVWGGGPGERGSLVHPEQWSFPVLIQRLLERMAGLHAAYGGGPLEADYRGLIEAAGRVRTVSSSLRWLDLFAWSGRQGRKIPVGGLVGQVVVEGDLEPFLPWLVWAGITGVGKYADRGNGRIELVPGG